MRIPFSYWEAQFCPIPTPLNWFFTKTALESIWHQETGKITKHTFEKITIKKGDRIGQNIGSESNALPRYQNGKVLRCLNALKDGGLIHVRN